MSFFFLKKLTDTVGVQRFVNPSEFSMFLHNYDLKCDLFTTQFLKLDKENQLNTWVKTAYM